MNRKDKALEFANQNWDIQITGRHVQVTDPMKDYAMDKISKVERFINRIIDVNVIMDIQKLDHRVEIILKFGGMKISSAASSTDMYASIDKAVDRLEAQILRYKSRIQDHHAKGLTAIDMNVNVLKRPSEEELISDEIEDLRATENRFYPHPIIKQKTLPLKTLTYDEAVMKMELSGDAFLVFKSEEDQKLKVIYRRKDENYGVIEPQF